MLNGAKNRSPTKSDWSLLMENKGESAELSKLARSWFVWAVCCWTLGFLIAMISMPKLKAFFAGNGIKLPEMTVAAIRMLDDPFPPALLFGMVIIMMTIAWMISDHRAIWLFKLVFIASIC